MKTKYYLLPVAGMIEPEVRGPFATEEEQDAEAKRIRKEEQEEEAALFWANVDETGNLEVGAYSGGFFMESEGEG